DQIFATISHRNFDIQHRTKRELAGPSCALNAIPAGPSTGLPKGKNLDEILKQEQLGRFATYLDAIEPSEADVDATADGSEEADLFSIFVELAGLRNETRTQSQIGRASCRERGEVGREAM